MRPGQRIGPYVVREELGRGAMGVVLRVEHPELGQEYALKLVRQDMLGDREAVLRFQREMQAMARVDDHPGVVRVHSAGVTDDGAAYFAMELVRGRSLGEAMRRGALGLEQALDVIEQVGRALQHLHARDLVHRDVKPENVLLDEEGRARLTDFGLARSLGLSQGQRLTRTGDLVGTPTHMAPEQALRTLGELGPWTDVYSLGVVLYEALTGRTPYTGATPIEVYTQVANGAAFPPPRACREDVDPALEAVCLKALARRPIDRYPDAGKLLEDLARARRGAGAPPPRRGVRRLALAAALAVGLAGAALGLARWRAADRARADALALATEVEALSGRLQRGGAEEVLEDARALLAAERRRPGGPRGSLEALLRVAGDAAARRVQEAWRAGDVATARASLDDAAPELAERAWILALTGELHDPAGLPDAADRVRLAAWRGDAAGVSRALAAVSPPDRARALAAELGLAAPPVDPLEVGPTSGWGHVARGEAALARGLLPLAALAFDEALAATPDPETEAAAALGLCRVAFARGDLEGATAQGVRALRRAASASPLTRGRALAWAAWVAVAAGKTPAPLSSALDGREALAAALRGAPGLPEVLAARSATRPADLPGAAWSATPPTLDAERRACDLGLLGPPGLLVARGAALALAAAEGNDAAAAAEALALLELACRARPRSALAWASVAAARRVLRQAGPALLAATRARELAPGCPLAALEEARCRALDVEDAALAADLARAAGRPDEGAERVIARRLHEVVGAFRAAGGDEGRLGAARALVERAWRELPETDEGAFDPARAALAVELDAELAPLLARVDVAAVDSARAALVDGWEGSDPAALERAELALAAAAWGQPPRAREPAELEALLLRAAGAGGERHARAFLALAGDLPARALRWTVRAEHVGGDAAASLERAAALAPDLPQPVLEAALGGRAATAPELRRLADLLPRAPELAALVVELTALAPRSVEEHARLLAELAGEEPAAGRARALLLAAVATGELVTDDRRDGAARAAWAEATQALALAPDDGGTRLLRALAGARAAGGAAPGAPCDPRVLPDVLFDARVARARAPWASAPRLVELDHGPQALALDAQEELLAQGFVGSAVGRLLPPRAAEALRLRLEALGPALASPDRRGQPALDVAGLVAARGAPRLALALRLAALLDDDHLADRLDPREAQALVVDAAAGRADVATAASTVWTWRRSGRASDEEDAAQITRGAVLALHRARVGGVGARLAPRQVRALGVVRDGPSEDPGERRVLARNLPDRPGVGDVWTGLARPERARAVLAGLWDDDDGGPFDDLLSPWGRGQALLRDVQAARPGWATEWFIEDAAPGEALLALERQVAFRRGGPAEASAYWSIFWHARWNALDADIDAARRATLAALARAAALRADAVAPSPALRALAADAALDHAALTSGDVLAAAREVLAAAAPDDVSRSLESGATSWWRVVRAHAVAGDAPAARAALERVRERVAAHDDWGLEWFVQPGDPALPGLAAVPEVAEFLRERGALAR